MRRGSALRDWAAGLPRLRRAACALTLLIAGAASAQSGELDRPRLENDAAAAGCVVTGGDAAMTYPSGVAGPVEGGTVRVRLTFRSPDGAPVADVFYDSVGEPFRTLVLERVARYRVPCLRPAAGVLVATQEFTFSQTVMWAPVRGESDERSREIGCFVGGDRMPSYPWSATDRVSRGTAIASFRFIAPNRPPEVRILSNGGSPRFARFIERVADEYRLPCLDSSAGPLEVSQTFRFALDGDPENYLPDGSILSFVASLDETSRGRVRFDFNTMGCPFQLGFVLRRPYLPNRVGEVGKTDANRRELIEWLSQAQFRLPNEKLRPVLTGSSMTIAVPCTVLDLT